ncbi:MAG TPA: Sir2 family NAD-dependent protein deacetylase [Stellaceae bacterium]|nr:Sir2 family NAD-dependent protein deacetylase [Stellaceae bacterium]
MSTPWAKPPRIVAFTGGALAREAGFAPFDPATMPAGLRLEEIVTSDGFARAPERVNDFYNRRRRELMQARPNAAYEGLAVLEAVRPQEVLIVTRNIDDLHERAGSKAVIHTHGELLKARCMICMKISERWDDITPESACPVCGNAGHLRPHVVWVGEEPLGMASVYEALAHCRLFLAIGVPVAAEPASGFAVAARRAGARRIAFNPEPPSDPGAFDEHIAGPLGETVPSHVKRLIAET